MVESRDLWRRPENDSLYCPFIPYPLHDPTTIISKPLRSNDMLLINRCDNYFLYAYTNTLFYILRLELISRLSILKYLV